jgi:ApbE superfamily uncharacterized protein (UPF0280 family)
MDLAPEANGPRLVRRLQHNLVKARVEAPAAVAGALPDRRIDRHGMPNQ